MTRNKKNLPLLVSMIAAMGIASSAFAAGWQYPQAAPVAEVAALAPASAGPAPYFTVSRDDVEKMVAEQIQIQSGEAKKINAIMDPGPQAILHAANHPLKVSLQALQIEPSNHRWQAQVFIIGNLTTEMVKPVAGRYETLVSVPVATRQLGASDVIDARDLSTRDIPERQLRKDTVVDVAALIGKSPVRMISATRPIRAMEVATPKIIKKGESVEMTYTTEHMHIRDSGEALEDGSAGALIRVKNSKTGKAVTARVEGAGHVEVNMARMAEGRSL